MTFPAHTAEHSSRSARLAPLLDGFSSELEKIAIFGGIRKAVSKKVGKTVIDGVTQHPENKARAQSFVGDAAWDGVKHHLDLPENRAKAQAFVRDAAWDGVKRGLRRNVGRIAGGATLAGAGAVAMHRHSKVKAQRERAELLNDLSSRVKVKRANLSGTSGSPTTIGQIKSTIPRNTMKSSGKYSQTHTGGSPSPAAQHQPVLSPPPVRG